MTLLTGFDHGEDVFEQAHMLRVKMIYLKTPYRLENAEVRQQTRGGSGSPM